MKETKTIREVMDEMKGASPTNPQLVRDWRQMLPAGSRWCPGDPGNPNCKTCEGTGYLRIESLPVTHKYYGQLVFCECVDVEKLRQKRAAALEDYDASALLMKPAGRRY
jgi:hypothetical protein